MAMCGALGTIMTAAWAAVALDGYAIVSRLLGAARSGLKRGFGEEHQIRIGSL